MEFACSDLQQRLQRTRQSCQEAQKQLDEDSPLVLASFFIFCCTKANGERDALYAELQKLEARVNVLA